MTLWTIRRYGPDPRNQLTREHMLGIVEAPHAEAAEREILDAPGVTLYEGQTLKALIVTPDKLHLRRVERARNATMMRERLGDGYDAWVVANGRFDAYALLAAKRTRKHRREMAVQAANIRPVTIQAAKAVPWFQETTAWLLRKRSTGELIYVVGTGVWRTTTDDGHDFARWLCGPYRAGVRPVMTCQAHDSHASQGWCPVRDRSYDAVAIARRVGEDRIKVIVLGAHEAWYDNDARPASQAVIRPLFDSLGRRIANGRMA
mgnify:CR=1 FL=1